MKTTRQYTEEKAEYLNAEWHKKWPEGRPYFSIQAFTGHAEYGIIANRSRASYCTQAVTTTPESTHYSSVNRKVALFDSREQMQAHAEKTGRLALYDTLVKKLRGIENK